MVVSKRESYSKKYIHICIWKKTSKYFIGYNDNDDIKPLCIRLPQMDLSVKSFKDSKKIENVF